MRDRHPAQASLDRDPSPKTAQARSVRKLIGFGGLALVLLVAFAALGTWQLQRRAWKLGLIAAVNARVYAPPVPPPGPSQWPAITAGRDAYRHVRLRGRFLNERETLVQAVSDYGSGYWVMTPLATDRGFIVLVNRGFVSQDQRDPSTRAAGEVEGATTLTGLLRISEPRGGFLQRNAPDQDAWRSRDVAAIAAARGLTGVAPYFVDADETPNRGGTPIGGLTVISFPNSHLAYAITWYALALLTVVAYAVVMREDLRR